jgi:hypothetical protein
MNLFPVNIPFVQTTFIYNYLKEKIEQQGLDKKPTDMSSHMLWAIFYFLQNFPQFTGRWFTGINTLVISAIIFPGLFEIIHLIDLN